MSNPIVTINLVVLNGEKYIRHCLDAVLAQTYPHELLEFNILDNGSTDKTVERITNYELRIKEKCAKFFLLKGKKNLGVWPGQEELLKYTEGKYVLALCVDVILDKDFIKNAVEAMEEDDKVGALQAKIYKYELSELSITNYVLRKEIIDTCGFEIFRSRRVTNIGHGQKDSSEFSVKKEIFAVEGAAPFFRREALEACRVGGKVIDHDFFWYGDDLDLAWRMRLLGWKEVFAPTVIAWHDRQTTKGLRKSWADFVRMRREVPIKKRRLDWRNTRFTILKNDYTINILKDLPYMAKRELLLLGYMLFFEPEVLLEIPNFLVSFPKVMKKRSEVMKMAKLSPKEIRKWFK